MKRTIVTLLDDLDNDVTAAETIEFMIDGEVFEIDLSDKNASKFRDQLEPWRSAARRTAGGRRRQRQGIPPRDRAYSMAVREWARTNGHSVSTRGRIPAKTVNAYEAANS